MVDPYGTIEQTQILEDTMNNIRILVGQFRIAIDRAKEAGEFNDDFSFFKFPRGCCGDTSDLLAHFLLKNGVRTQYICGIYRPASKENIQSHAWLLTNGQIIIDITGDQFRDDPDFLNYHKSIYIGEIDDFHKMFRVDSSGIRDNNGLDALGSFCRPRLKKLYKKIMSYY